MKPLNFSENLLQDIRFASGTLRRSPGFMTTAILALALGIGANTAIFTVVNTVLLQPLAYPEPERLVQLEWKVPQGNQNITSIPKFMVWREQTQVFQDVAAYGMGGAGRDVACQAPAGAVCAGLVLSGCCVVSAPC